MVNSEVCNFYSGKSIFVTGGTGFLGKVLIEKLLYSCDGINKIYVLIREKKGKNTCDRLKQLTESMVLDRVKAEKSEKLQKIVPMTGNIELENLGLTEEHLEILKKEVSVVFHVAATVAFQQPLKEALLHNVEGTREVIKLCQQMENLQALIHVSTAYSNAQLRKVDEMVYPPVDSSEHVTFMAERFSDDEYIMKKLLGDSPNTYAYTKALAEVLVMEQQGIIPAAIIRPSIIISSSKEPQAGWIDTWHGATGVFANHCTGILKVLMGGTNNVVDLVPADIVANLGIVAATKCARSKKIEVYNCCTGKSNPVTIGRLQEIARKVTKTHNCSLSPLPFTFEIFVKSTFLYYLLGFFLNYLPAVLFDIVLCLRGKRTFYVKSYEKFDKMARTLSYFLVNEWEFEDNNSRALLNTMSEGDKTIFNFDVKTFDWYQVIEDFMLGIIKFLINKKQVK